MRTEICCSRLQEGWALLAVGSILTPGGVKEGSFYYCSAKAFKKNEPGRDLVLSNASSIPNELLKGLLLCSIN